MIVGVAPSFARPELLASADWLAGNLSRAGVRILDCRWRVDGRAPELFAEGHIPGASFVDWPAELTDPGPGQPFRMGTPDGIAAALRQSGVGPETTAVLYDDTASFYAARVWWTLVAHGFGSAAILDGGWPAWRDAGHERSTAPSSAEPAMFTGQVDGRRRVGTAELLTLLGSPDTVLVDARNPAEYLGQQTTSGRYGHLPGAVNVAAVLMTWPGLGAFRDAASLARLFRARAVLPQRRVVVYDSTGIGAAKVAYVLTLLGYPQVAVYDPGLCDWGDGPLERR